MKKALEPPGTKLSTLYKPMLRRFREQELSDLVFDLVTLAKAPGTKEQWEDIVHPIKKVLQFLTE